jgi:hypothetical protein
MMESVSIVQCDLEESSYLHINDDFYKPAMSFNSIYHVNVNPRSNLYSKCHNIARINEIIDGNIYCGKLCNSCIDILSKRLESSYEDIQEEIRAYALAIRQSESHPLKCSLELEDHDDDENDPSSLSEALHVARDNVQKLNILLNDDRRNIEAVEAEHIELLNKYTKAMVEVIGVDENLKRNRNELITSLDLINNTINEIEFLASPSLGYAFDIEIENFSFNQKDDENYLSHDAVSSVDMIPLGSINGYRLSYETSAHNNLNWAEINMAWACLTLFLTALRNRANLSSHVILENEQPSEVSVTDLPRNSIFMLPKIYLTIRSLRRRALVFVSYCNHNDNDNNDGHALKKDSDVHEVGMTVDNDTVTQSSAHNQEDKNDRHIQQLYQHEDSPFCLEGGDDDPQDYETAVLLFLSFTVITLREMGFPRDIYHGSLLKFNESVEERRVWEHAVDEDVSYYDAKQCRSSSNRRGNIILNELVHDMMITLQKVL